MTNLVAAVGFNNAILGALTDLGSATGVPVPAGSDSAFLMTTPLYQYAVGGYNFDNYLLLVPTSGNVTGLYFWNTVAVPDQLMFTLSGFDVTIGDLATAAALGADALQTLFFGGADTFFGSGSADLFFGFGGIDLMLGNGGGDTLTGGLGADKLHGGLGRDGLHGGPGLDDFYYFAIAESKPGAAFRDTISGFVHGDDIDLRAIDADRRAANPGNDVFKFIGAVAFNAYHAAHPGVFGMVRIAAGNIVEITNDADMAAEMQISIVGVAPAGADFLL